jgi:hypothetical protein
MVRDHEGGQVRPPATLSITRSLVLSTVFLAGAALFACTENKIIVDDSPEGGVPTEETDGGEPTDEDGGSSGTVAGACPKSGTLETTAIDAPEAVESSGIVESKQNAGVYWIHNDSGDTARAFAIGSDGHLVATLSFDTVKPRDIEDIAIEDDGDTSFLYFGDIGDNDEVRTELTIHRVEEPKLGSSPTVTATSQKMTVVYEDGAHNAETLLFDPTTKDLLIATKKAGGPSYIHKVGPFQAGKKVTTEKIATVDVDTATGGEISRDGKYIAIRNYSKSVFVWVRGDGESLADALAHDACKLPLATEGQGEAFAWQVDNAGYVTVSEGTAELHVTPLK